MIVAIIVGAVSVVGAATALISIISSSDEDKDSTKALEQEKKSEDTSKSDRGKASGVQVSPDKVVEDNKPVETSQDLGATGITPGDNSDKQDALQARYLREGAKAKVHSSESASSKVTRPTRRPAVKSYDWSNKSM